MSNKQNANGNNNTQAQGDITYTYNFENYKPKAIHFYEKDIKNVIEEFSGYFNQNKSEVSGDIYDGEFDYTEKVEKNRLNSLSEDYFEYIQSEHLQYFYKIDSFLKDPKNKTLLDNYNKTAFEIKFKIQTMRSLFSSFDEILGELYNGLVDKNVSGLEENRDLYIVFITYMYWNCDIGKKR